MVKEMPERECENCIFRDGCRLIHFVDKCEEHKFSGEDKEYERGVLGDKQYQGLKEEDF